MAGQAISLYLKSWMRRYSEALAFGAGVIDACFAALLAGARAGSQTRGGIFYK